MPTLTAHCLVKNEENFIRYALLSVVDFVDRIIVFDTGSTDATVAIVRELQSRYPTKIVWEEKGECDAARHSVLRQEMIERTATDWFMILDGDEVWTRRGMEAARAAMQSTVAGSPSTECLIAPFYLCVGDIFHTSKKGHYVLRGRRAHATPRFFKMMPGIHWRGEYNNDAVVDAANQPVFEKEAVVWLDQPFWHVSHLQRSSRDDEEFSSGGRRKDKRRLTYFFIGKKVTAPVPEVFASDADAVALRLSWGKSFINFVRLLFAK